MGFAEIEPVMIWLLGNLSPLVMKLQGSMRRETIPVDKQNIKQRMSQQQH